LLRLPRLGGRGGDPRKKAKRVWDGFKPPSRFPTGGGLQRVIEGGRPDRKNRFHLTKGRPRNKVRVYFECEGGGGGGKREREREEKKATPTGDSWKEGNLRPEGQRKGGNLQGGVIRSTFKTISLSKKKNPLRETKGGNKKNRKTKEVRRLKRSASQSLPCGGRFGTKEGDLGKEKTTSKGERGLG